LGIFARLGERLKHVEFQVARPADKPYSVYNLEVSSEIFLTLIQKWNELWTE